MHIQNYWVVAFPNTHPSFSHQKATYKNYLIETLFILMSKSGLILKLTIK